MAAINVSSFNHTSFTVGDLDQAIGFFRDGLGFRLLSRAPRNPQIIQQMTGIAGADVEIAFVEGPGHTIELVHYLAPEAEQGNLPRLCDPGAAHLALNIADMDGAVTVAADYGFTLVGQVVVINAGPNAGNRVAYLKNSDGIIIEFIEKPS